MIKAISVLILTFVLSPNIIHEVDKNDPSIEDLYMKAIIDVENFLSSNYSSIVDKSIHLNISEELNDSIPTFTTLNTSISFQLIDVNTGKKNPESWNRDLTGYTKYWLYDYEKPINTGHNLQIGSLLSSNGIEASFTKIFKEEDFYHTVIWLNSMSDEIPDFLFIEFRNVYESNIDVIVKTVMDKMLE